MKHLITIDPLLLVETRRAAVAAVTTRVCASAMNHAMKRLERKPDYKFDDGDWTCSRCRKSNFRKRGSCFGCGVSKGASGAGGLNGRTSLQMAFGAAAGAAAAEEKGRGRDWNCTECKHVNFGFRSECEECHVRRKVQTVKGDWFCPGCSDYQFAKNKECRKCKTPKPCEKECIVCCESTETGLECSGFHFACAGCLVGDLNANGIDRVTKDGDVVCMFPDCDCLFKTDEVVRHVPVQTLMKYIKDHQERELEAQNKELLKGDVGDLIVRGYFNHITDKILSLSCPSCDKVFIDFSGCCALQCSNCHCDFCAWCLEASADSGACHRHVAACKDGNGSYFSNGGMDGGVGDKMMALRTKKFNNYWALIDKKSQEKLWPRVQPLLSGLVDINELGR